MNRTCSLQLRIQGWDLSVGQRRERKKRRILVHTVAAAVAVAATPGTLAAAPPGRVGTPRAQAAA
ncbi:hypothetical protein ACFV08_15255, partial [Streptomyces fradiae]|uniref:hypothetical protein n=1 Tax=Streptomyces fradiae TaxID=1906 RepID=UPI0036A1A3A7